ncbi:MAG: sigma-54 dependent transcriptional regulator [Bacteroidetes bacterium]|nr:sigma-54 dependent transcriptional regulator [Bacteroidota bacterium]
MNKGNILIVDDNQNVLNSLELFLKYKFTSVYTLSKPDQILALIKAVPIDVILLDMNFTSSINTGNEGIFWMKQIQKEDPTMVIILITAYGDVELAVKVIKEGATDFVLKPWDNHKLLATLQSALELKKSRDEIKSLKKKQIVLKESKESEYSSFIYKSEQIAHLFKTVEKVAGTDVNILIQGENGTGKEVLAYEIHKRSKQKQYDFLKVDIGSLNESIFESELFGHKKGSFTDAKEDRIGKFETVSGGTLFLDEIGNISVSLQSKLLYVLQNKKVTPVGSNEQIPVDFRLICATNKDLEKLVTEKLFREDLQFRINTITLIIPPLRERIEDIPLLAEYFLERYKRKYEKNSIKFNAEAIEILQQYPWPGNVRELKHTIEKAIILCESEIIRPEDLFLKSRNLNELNTNLNPQSISDNEKILISSTLHKNNGNISKTAIQLKIGRQTLYRKIKQYKINLDGDVEE